MEKYDVLASIGEGSYGTVIKCRHRETGQLVAIKKFLETEDDQQVKKIALREVKILKQLRHENLVNLIEVFKKKKRLYLVFELVDHTLLHEMEANPHGMSLNSTRACLFQILRALDFCHSKNVIHRDVKPENVLISKNGVMKLCDFGFARSISNGEAMTDYVATRWYRAPELLVGDITYGKPVDVWAVGCLVAEMMTGAPLYPGDSDIDQLNRIIRSLGNLCERHQNIFRHSDLFRGAAMLPVVSRPPALEAQLKTLSTRACDFMRCCLYLEPSMRATCRELLQHNFFAYDGFVERFPEELKVRLKKEEKENPLARVSTQPKQQLGPETMSDPDSGHHGGRTSKDPSSLPPFTTLPPCTPSLHPTEAVPPMIGGHLNVVRGPSPILGAPVPSNGVPKGLPSVLSSTSQVQATTSVPPLVLQSQHPMPHKKSKQELLLLPQLAPNMSTSNPSASIIAPKPSSPSMPRINQGKKSNFSIPPLQNTGVK